MHQKWWCTLVHSLSQHSRKCTHVQSAHLHICTHSVEFALISQHSWIFDYFWTRGHRTERRDDNAIPFRQRLIIYPFFNPFAYKCLCFVQITHISTPQIVRISNIPKPSKMASTSVILTTCVNMPKYAQMQSNVTRYKTVSQIYAYYLLTDLQTSADIVHASKWPKIIKTSKSSKCNQIMHPIKRYLNIIISKRLLIYRRLQTSCKYQHLSCGPNAHQHLSFLLYVSKTHKICTFYKMQSNNAPYKMVSKYYHIQTLTDLQTSADIVHGSKYAQIRTRIKMRIILPYSGSILSINRYQMCQNDIK